MRRPPGYALFVALVYFFVGPRPLAVVALQVLLTMATPVVFRRVLTGIGLDHRHALVGSVACVLYIFPYIYVQQLITEPLTTFLVVVGAAVATRTWTIGFSAPGQAFLAGILCKNGLCEVREEPDVVLKLETGNYSQQASP